MKKIYIASDHGGFALKNKIVAEVELPDVTLEDLGPFELDPNDDYPDFAKLVADRVAENPDSLGILICRSGNGMVIAANKFRGVYAALCFTEKHAEMARRHDNANILCLDSDYETVNQIEIVRTFVASEFEGMGSRHGRRFRKVQGFEENS